MQCSGITKKGLPCKKKVKGGKFCYYHNKTQPSETIVYKFEKPEDCVVCTDPLNETQPLAPCGHWVHRECQLRSGRKCVLCRTDIVFSKEEEKTLIQKELEDRKEAERINLEAARNINTSEQRQSHARYIGLMLNHNGQLVLRYRNSVYNLITVPDEFSIDEIADFGLIDASTYFSVEFVLDCIRMLMRTDISITELTIPNNIPYMRRILSYTIILSNISNIPLQDIYVRLLACRNEYPWRMIHNPTHPFPRFLSILNDIL